MTQNTDTKSRISFREMHLLFVLLMAYIVSYMDRAALAVLVEPVKTDLNMTDTQMGLLIGFAFAFLYSTIGLAMGRLADSWNRRRLIVGGMVVWLFSTGISAFARGPFSLAAARVGVGVGEAALSPASYSLIASIVPRHRLALASSIYALGVTLGIGVGTFIVGFLSQIASDGFTIPFLDPGTRGWRTTFVLLALAGLPVLLLAMTLPEPRVRRAGKKILDGEAADERRPGWGEVWQHLKQGRLAFAGIIGGYSIMAIAGGGAVWWGPTWMIRSHGLTAPEAGQLQGLFLAVFGSIGLIVGGMLADRLYRRGKIDAAPRIVLLSLLTEAPLFTFAYLTPGTPGLVAYAAAIFCFSMQGGLQGTSLQLMALPRMRGLVVSIFLMTANLAGMALGPVLVPALAEHWLGSGPDAIGHSLAIVTPVAVAIAATLIFVSLGAFRRQVHKIEKMMALPPSDASGSPPFSK